MGHGSFRRLLPLVFLLLLVIAAVTAFVPSRRAARMKAADALRHYE